LPTCRSAVRSARRTKIDVESTVKYDSRSAERAGEIITTVRYARRREYASALASSVLYFSSHEDRSGPTEQRPGSRSLDVATTSRQLPIKADKPRCQGGSFAHFAQAFTPNCGKTVMRPTDAEREAASSRVRRMRPKLPAPPERRVCGARVDCRGWPAKLPVSVIGLLCGPSSDCAGYLRWHLSR
jgi:hypothetical protein